MGIVLVKVPVTEGQSVTGQEGLVRKVDFVLLKSPPSPFSFAGSTYGITAPYG